MRNFSIVDRVLIELDRGLRAASGAVRQGERPVPQPKTPQQPLSAAEKKHSIGLMRVNHVGEVCAQALYFSQTLTEKDPEIKGFLLQSAQEEADHLAWCYHRIDALGGRISYLNPLWYGGSFVLGCMAGMAGRAWGLGFVTETERQVEAHLSGHLKSLPEHDVASRAIVTQMMADERAHGDTAQILGAYELPLPIKYTMRIVAKCMTKTAYWI